MTYALPAGPRPARRRGPVRAGHRGSLSLAVTRPELAQPEAGTSSRWAG